MKLLKLRTENFLFFFRENKTLIFLSFKFRYLYIWLHYPKKHYISKRHLYYFRKYIVTWIRDLIILKKNSQNYSSISKKWRCIQMGKPSNLISIIIKNHYPISSTRIRSSKNKKLEITKTKSSKLRILCSVKYPSLSKLLLTSVS